MIQKRDIIIIIWTKKDLMFYLFVCLFEERAREEETFCFMIFGLTS